MTCPDEDSLVGFLTGSADVAVAELVEKHIVECSSCLDTLEELQQSSPTPVWQRAEVSAYANEEAFMNALSLVQQVPFEDSHWHHRHDLPAVEPEAYDSLEFSQLGDYRILDCLGRGGMGRVYRAIHTKLDKTVAIKTIASTARNKSKAQQLEADARFQLESKAIGRLDHPNIVRATDARIIDGTRFLVMEFVDGQDLSAFVKGNGPLSIEDARGVVLDVANGLKHAHENGIIHRDIKPRNMMVTSTDDKKIRAVKLLDLGLATLAQDSIASDATSSDANFVGTPDYIAPEQATVGGHIDERSDIYSLGCTLYYLLTGKPPFHEAASTQAKLLSHTTKVPTELSVLRPDLPSDAIEDIDAILKKMMAKSPENRYQSVDELIDALSASETNPGELVTDLHAGNRRPTQREANPFSAWDRKSYVGWPLVALAVFGCIFLLATVLTIKLSKGTLIVDASPEVEVSALGDNVKVIDTKTERTFLLSIGENRLKPGGYKIIAEDVAQGYSFSSEEFSIVRGEETRISVRLENKAKTLPATNREPDIVPESFAEKSDAEVAVWLFEKGARRLRIVRKGMQPFWIGNRLEVPEGCQILAIDLGGQTSFGDRDLERIVHLKQLKRLGLYDTSVTDSGMRIVGSIPSLEHVDVSIMSSLTEKGFRFLAPLPNLRILRYVRADITPEKLLAIGKLTSLTSLGLKVRDVPETSFQPLSSLRDLQELTFEESSLDGSFITYFLECKNLRHLAITSDRLEADKLKPVSQLKNLDYLSITHSNIDRTFLPHIKDLKNLESIVFVRSTVEDDDAEFFQSFPKLRLLELRFSEISDEFVARLGIIPTLRTLNLADTNLTDASVEHLAKMSQLDVLYLGRTKMTRNGIGRLVQSLPSCRIDWDRLRQ